MTKRHCRWRRLWPGVVCALTAWVWAADNPIPAANQQSLFPTTAPAQRAGFTLNDLSQRWDGFEHAPLNSSGFSAVILPFHTPPGEQKRLEPLANSLAFLLSLDLDWADNNFNSRHAYHVFQHEKNLMQQQRRSYDPQEIAGLIERWKGTHAIGGEIQGDNSKALTGKLQIFDANGKVILEKAYTQPQEFQQLLGNITCDAMKFLQYEPSAALTEFLHQRRWGELGSLLVLGSVAYENEQSEQRLEAARQILLYDPDFAEVRYWIAHHLYLMDNNRPRFIAESVEALKTRPIASVFKNINPDELRTAAGRQAEQWVRKTDALVGSQSPILLIHRLKGLKKDDRLDETLRDQMLMACARLPNNVQLLECVRPLLMGTSLDAISDMDLAVSMALTEITGKNQLGRKITDVALAAGEGMFATGYAPDAMSLVRQFPEVLKMPGGQLLTLQSLVSMGQFAEAVEVGKHLPHDESYEVEAVYIEAMAAALSGNLDRCRQLRQDYRMDLDYWAMTPLLVAYEDMAAGRPVDLLRFPEISKHGAAWALEQRVICELLAALQLDTRSPNEAKLLNYARATPTNRQLMIALEKYAQKWNLPQANGLREGWGWLHPDDPWSKSPSEKPSPPPLTGDALLAILSGFNAEPYPVNTMEKTEAAKMVFAKVSPWEVLAVVRQLLEQKQPDKALLIALKYRHATASMLYPQLRVFANHLVYEIKRINAGKHPPLIPLDIEGSGRPV